MRNGTERLLNDPSHTFASTPLVTALLWVAHAVGDVDKTISGTPTLRPAGVAMTGAYTTILTSIAVECLSNKLTRAASKLSET